MKIFVTPNQDSPYNLMISHPAYLDITRNSGEPDDQVLTRTISRFREVNKIGDDVESHIVEDTAIPHDHNCNTSCEFFDAWEWRDSGARVNMAKARTIHMNNIRAIRDRELAAKDISFMRAVEDGNTDAQATIKAEKQSLRDIPQTFDITTGVDTPEKLKAKWPDGLPKE